MVIPPYVKPIPIQDENIIAHNHPKCNNYFKFRQECYKYFLLDAWARCAFFCLE